MNDKLEISVIPQKRAFCFDNTAIGIVPLNESVDQIYVYDIDRKENVKKIREIKRKDAIFYQENRDLTRMVSNKGAIIIMDVEDNSLQRNIQCTIKAFDISTYKIIKTFVISDLFAWWRNYRVSDAILLKNGKFLVTCIQDNGGIDDKGIVVVVDNKNHGEIVDIMEIGDGFLNALLLNETGTYCHAYVQEKMLVNEPYYLSTNIYTFRINVKEKKLELKDIGNKLEEMNWVRQNGYDIQIKDAIFSSFGEIAITNKSNNVKVFKKKVKRLRTARVQPVGHMGLIIIYISGFPSETHILKMDDKVIQELISIEGSIIDIKYIEGDDNLTIEYTDKTLYIRKQPKTLYK